MITAIVGVGNLGWNLAEAFRSHEIDAHYLIDRNPEKIKLLQQQFTRSKCILLEEIPNDIDLVFLCLPDDQLIPFANHIRNAQCAVVHCSGNTANLELKPNKTGVFYPFQTFTRNRAVEWSEIPICIESSDEKLKAFLIKTATKLSNRILEITLEQRKNLHIAGVFGANFNNHLLHLINEQMSKSELPLDLIKPLVEESISKAFDLGPAKAQTGPAIRRDENVIKDHLKRLENDPTLLKFYTLFTDSIQNQ